MVLQNLSCIFVFEQQKTYQILNKVSGIHRLHLKTGSRDFVSENKHCTIDDDPKDPWPLNTKFTLLRDEALQLLDTYFTLLSY